MKRMSIEPGIENDKLYRLMGSRPGRDIPRALARRVKQQTKIIDDLLSPWLTYATRPIQAVSDNAVYIADLPTIKSRRIANTLRGCTHAVAFLATIGEDISEAVDELSEENHMSDAYIMDSMGSVAVEDLVDQFHRRIERKNLDKGRSVTIRFSPGYCDWDITEQRKLFMLFEQHNPRVTLTSSCLMEPRKSISGLFGILPFDNGMPVSKYVPCRDCGKKDCIARRGG